MDERIDKLSAENFMPMVPYPEDIYVGGYQEGMFVREWIRDMEYGINPIYRLDEIEHEDFIFGYGPKRRSKEGGPKEHSD